MFRQFTAIAFMAVMTLLITLKHPVLGYCICLDAYFTGACQCQSQSTNPADSSNLVRLSQFPRTSCKSCCTSKTDKKSVSSIGSPLSSDESAQSRSENTPCDDCVKQLVVDVGDYHWQSSGDLPDAAESVIQPVSFQSAYHPWLCQQTILDGSMSSRGDPPPGVHHSDIPHRLEHSVFRL